MRVQPFSVNSVVHVIKRGARGMNIVRDEKDSHRFISLLYYLNDEYKNDYWEDELIDLAPFERPDSWPKRKPLVDVLAFTLMPNHFHLVLREIKDGGVSRFMQRLGGSMSMYHNLKYKEKGTIFQGAYKGRTVDDDAYLRYLASYVMVKNVFELYPHGGLLGARKDFKKAWDWAQQYPYSSLPAYSGESDSPVIAENNIMRQMFSSPKAFKSASFDMIEAYLEKFDHVYPEKELE
jgi:Transposase IS200 like